MSKIIIIPIFSNNEDYIPPKNNLKVKLAKSYNVIEMNNLKYKIV